MKKLEVILALLVVVGLTSPIFAQSSRFAVVVGNSNYLEISKLKNPSNDSQDIAEALKSLGFQVDSLVDADLPTMEDAVVRLGSQLSTSKDAIGFFFYAGHGVQSGGTNYLIPTDAHIPSEPFLRTKALSAQEVLDVLQQAHNSLNVVVLDACRDNPFSWARSGARGLNVVAAQPPGSIIAFATSAGSIAQDGQGRNGVFTGALLMNLRTPGLEIGEVFKRTGAYVQAMTNGQQNPAIYSQFFGNAYLSSQSAALVAEDGQEAANNLKPSDSTPIANSSTGGSFSENQSNYGSEEISAKISLMLFEKDYLDNSKQSAIRKLSSSLTQSQKRDLFDKYRSNGFWAALGNTFLGAGSWFQGDYWGGAAITGGWLVGGLLLSTSPPVNGKYTTQGNIGGLIGGCALIAGWIRPFTIAIDRNQRLAVALQFTQ
ncbi:MAG: caspase family protein [Spirochaetia bacterium]|jgi:hypothetical protein